MISRILTRLAAAIFGLIGGLTLFLWAVARVDPDLHGAIGLLILLGLPSVLLTLAWVFKPSRRP